MNALLDAALGYAARGWPVFPCRPSQKTPATPHGVLDATTDPAQIRGWWADMPTANVAIATGAPGPDVLDIDVKPGGSGWPALSELSTAGLTAGAAAMVSTPSGGLHMYFAGTSQRNGTIRGRHIDFRATGGYVIAPPSTVDGKPYQPTGDLAGTGPADWHAIRTLLDPPPDPQEFRQPTRTTTTAPGELRPGDDWATRTTWDQILAPHGWRKIRDLGGGRACWCRPGKTGHFTSATTRDDGGLYVFSTSTVFDPEVPYSKFGTYAVLKHSGDHTAAAAQLRREGYGTPATATPSVTQPVTSEPQDDAAGLPDYDLGALAAEGISEPQRIAGGMLYPGSVHCLAGAPGGGKTTLMAWWMIQHIRDGGHVMLLDEESGPEQAAEKFLDLGAKPSELSPPHFTYVPFPARRWTAADLAQLHQLIRQRAPGIIGWDSAAAFLAIAGQDENSATDVTAFWQRVLVPCARQFLAAVVAIDHITKTGEHGGYGRGSGAKKAASDVQYILETVEPFNRKQDGLLRLTTAPGKDRRGWLAPTYDVRVKTGDTITLNIGESVVFRNPVNDRMPPARAHLWEALNAIATENSPATGDQLVDWIVAHKASKGLKRQTVSTELTKLVAAGLADSMDRGVGRYKLWWPLPADSDHPRSAASADTTKSVSKTNDLKPQVKPSVSVSGHVSADVSASGPFRGADDDDTADADTTKATLGAAS